jgi:peptidoglycan/LPS O-acetylase OafA/YrhL
VLRAVPARPDIHHDRRRRRLLGYAIWYWLHATGTRDVLGAVASAWCLALAMWLFVSGSFGSSSVYSNDPSVDSLSSDSSYWLYLVHMPVLLVFQIAAAETSWPPA